MELKKIKIQEEMPYLIQIALETELMTIMIWDNFQVMTKKKNSRCFTRIWKLDEKESKCNKWRDWKRKKKLNEKINPILEKAQARRNLENNINDMRRRMEDPNDPINGLSPDERKKINDCVNDAGDWMKKNPGASKKDNDQKLKEFLNKLEPYTNKSKKRKDLQDEANILRNRALDNNELGNHLSEDEKKKNFGCCKRAFELAWE